MSQIKKDDCLKKILQGDDEKPEIYAVRKQKEGIFLSRRAFLGSIGAGMVLGSFTGCISSRKIKKIHGQIKLLDCSDFKAHSSAVNSVAISPDGNTLVSGSLDKTIKLWSLPEGKLINKLIGHSNPVRLLTISPDGRLLVSVSGYKIKLWTLPNGKLVNTLTGNSYEVTSIAISPNGNTLISSSLDKTVKLWSLPEGKLTNKLIGHSSFVKLATVSPDGTLLASVSGDASIKLWSLPEGNLINTLKCNSHKFTSAVISPDGKLLVSGSFDKTIKIWSLPEGKLVNTLESHSGTVYSMAISPDGTFLVSVCDDGTIDLWTLPDGKKVNTLGNLRIDDKNINELVAISPDGTMLAVGSYDIIKFWSLPGGELINVLEYPSGWVNSIAFSPVEKIMASGWSDKNIRFVSLPDGKPNWCLYDPAITKNNTEAITYRHFKPETPMAPGTPSSSNDYYLRSEIHTVPCGTPTPPNAVCICDCVNDTIRYSGPRTVCICDTISVPAGRPIPAGAICVCNTIAVGTYKQPVPKSSSKKQYPAICGCHSNGGGGGSSGGGRYCTCNTICTCESVGGGGGGHYWYPN